VRKDKEPKKDLQDLHVRIIQESTDDLLEMVGVNRHEYREEALHFARAELLNRGISVSSQQLGNLVNPEPVFTQLTNHPEPKWVNTAGAIYLLLVFMCILYAFDFEGLIDPTWTLILILLTLPGSLISLPLAWALIHGAGLGFFALLYLGSAALNVFIVHRIVRHFVRRRRRFATGTDASGEHPLTRSEA